MADLHLLENLLANVAQVSYPELLAILFFAGLLEVIFPPVPGDAVFLAGGFIAGRRGFPLTWAIVLAFLGTFLAATALFIAGRVCGPYLFRRRFFARILPEPQRQRVEKLFTHYGLWLILSSRFIPVVRSGIALAAGMTGMRPAFGLVGLAGGIAVFNSLLIVGGSEAGEHWPVLAARLGGIGWAVLALGLAILAARAFFSRRRS